MKLTLILLVVGYILLVWSVRKMRRAARAAEAARMRDSAHAALEAKYSVPLMSEAQIAEMHASRWQGD